jgi:hypothetical protein
MLIFSNENTGIVALLEYSLKTMLLRMYHDAGDHAEIREPAELTLQKLEIPLPIANSLEATTYVMSNSQNRFDGVIVEANDNLRLVGYSNRGYEIAGDVNGKIVMRRTLSCISCGLSRYQHEIMTLNCYVE